MTMHIVLINIAAIFVMIFLGYASRRGGLLNAETTGGISKLVTYCFYPVLIFASVTSGFTLPSLLSHWTLPAGALLIMALGLGVGLAAGRLVRFSSVSQERAYRFQCTMNNYSFLPLPLALLFWGEPGMAAIALSTVGSELAVWTIGVLALTGEKPRLSFLRRLFNLPMAAIAAAGIFLLLSHLLLPARGFAWLSSKPALDLKAALWPAMQLFGKAAIPLAMVVAGSRLAELRPERLFSSQLLLLTVLRLVAIPGAAILLLHLLPFAHDVRQTLALVAVMPCAVSSVMLSDVYGADSEFAAACVLLTHVFCLATVPLWLSAVGVG